MWAINSGGFEPMKRLFGDDWGVVQTLSSESQTPS
jgi:hypothetical protein